MRRASGASRGRRRISKDPRTSLSYGHGWWRRRDDDCRARAPRQLVSTSARHDHAGPLLAVSASLASGHSRANTRTIAKTFGASRRWNRITGSRQRKTAGENPPEGKLIPVARFTPARPNADHNPSDPTNGDCMPAVPSRARVQGSAETHTYEGHQPSSVRSGKAARSAKLQPLAIGPSITGRPCAVKALRHFISVSIKR